MKRASIKTTVEQALDTITLSSWNRQRSTAELRDFISRREAAVADVEL